jgi:hypothetical protein
VDWGVLGLIELVSDLGGQEDLPFSLGGEELLAPFGVALDVLLDDLIGRDVDHVVLDREIGTSCVDTKSLLVIHKDHLRSEFPGQLIIGCF